MLASGDLAPASATLPCLGASVRRTRRAVRIQLDRETCTGHGRCYALAPEVYAADDEGNCVLLFERIPEELEEQAKRAALNCPEDALAVVEDE